MKNHLKRFWGLYCSLIFISTLLCSGVAGVFIWKYLNRDASGGQEIPSATGGTTTVVNKELITNWRLSSKATRTEDEYWIMLNSLFESQNINFDQIKDAIISSVVPDLTITFIRMSEKYLNIKPI